MKKVYCQLMILAIKILRVGESKNPRPRENGSKWREFLGWYVGNRDTFDLYDMMLDS